MAENRSIGGLPNSLFETSKQGKNYLFAIGISSYQKFASLPNAVKDIKDLAQLLVEEYSFEPIQLLIENEATKDNIVDKLNDLRRKLTQDDRLLIYYSGHGYMDGERGFWIPVDAEPDKVSSYVSNADVHDTIKAIKVKHLLLISDSCFSGSLLTRDVSTKMEGAFEEWDKKPSRFVFISGGGPVSDGKAGENSPFANGIINNLKENEDDTINICKLADRVTEQVRYNYKQQAEVSPLFDAGHMGGQFVFVKKRTEKEIWALAITHNDEGSFLDYLNKYPDGSYKIEAEKKLKDIADENEWNKAKEKNAAFAYRHYLKIYPDGMNVKEAKDRLEEIRSQDIRENEEATEEIQRKNIETQKEKKDKEIEKPKPQSNRIINNQLGFFKKNIFLIAFFGLIIIPGSIFWYFKTVKNSAKNSKVYLTGPLGDTTITNINTLSESPFQITGDIVDEANKNKLSGIILTNKRTKERATTDALGHFRIRNTLKGDTILVAENANYKSSFFIASQVKEIGDIGLQEKPKIKTISGKVTGVIKWEVYVERNGIKIEPIWKGISSGTYQLKDVIEGDIFCINTNIGRDFKKVGKENNYDFLGDSIIAH